MWFPLGSIADSRNDLDLFELTLEELSQVKIHVPAAITHLSPLETPAATTIIDAKQIRITPARNIYDLIEIYVPGAYVLGHEEGPHPGIRGNIVNRNYKYLLLVNGRNMNNKAFYGAKSELEQWNLDDVKRIEIVRGPGSVTYGPGAVAGVINIITHDADSANGSQVALHYNHTYASKGASFRYGKQFKNFDWFGFASITRTKGNDSRQYQVNDNDEIGYVGKDIMTDTEPEEYFADYHDNPQIKLFSDLNFKEHWRLWMRYTQQGSTWRGNEAKTIIDGNLVNQAGTRDRQVTVALENEFAFSDKIKIQNMLSVDSLDVERRISDLRHPDPDHIQNFKTNHSETEFFWRGMLNWSMLNWAEVAIGAELSRDYIRSGWGDSDLDLRVGDDGNIVSGPDSNVIDGVKLTADNATFVGSGWKTTTYSVFGELNLELNSHNKLLVSGRVDKNTHARLLFSPRIALIFSLNRNNVIKLIAQRSQRMNTAGQLYEEREKGNAFKAETLDSIELTYSANLYDDLLLNLATFLNETDVVSWENDRDRSILLGHLQTFGFELEGLLKKQWGVIGGSYSLVKQLNWELEEGITSSGISYAEVNHPVDGSNVVLQGVGNDLNNWPNHSLKLFSQLKIMPKMLLHFDARLFWEFQGLKDGLTVLEEGVAGEPEEAEVDLAIQKVKSKNVYEFDFRLNASLSYHVLKNLEASLFIQNLLGVNDNKRYSLDTGNRKLSPKRVRFVEEPRSFGLKLKYQF